MLIFWNIILPVIGTQTQSLSITSNDFLFSLNLFPNIKSLYISCSFPYDSHNLSTIIESEQFNKLQILKIQSNFCHKKSPYTNYEHMEKILFET